MKTGAEGRAQSDGAAVAASEQADEARVAPARPARTVRGAAPERPAPRAPEGPAAVAPMLATSATPALARSTAQRWGQWAEMKWDGVRAVGSWEGGMLRLYARRGTDITARYPELTAADIGLDAGAAVVDGEIVALDAAGRPSFARLQARMHLTGARQIDAERRRTPVRYHVFDILALDGEDLAPRPLRERRALLERIAASTAAEVVVPPVFDDVGDALETAQRLALEGIVVKDPASGYRRGARSDQWLKVKLTRTQEVVIGGIRPGRGGRTGQIGSLLLGIPDGEGLRYVGRVGSGFSESTLERLQEVLEPLRTDADPFVGVPAADARDALWVRPDVVGEVEFAEFSPGGALRHARWRGLRPDKAPSEVRREG